MLKFVPVAFSITTLAFLPMASGSSKGSRVGGAAAGNGSHGGADIDVPGEDGGGGGITGDRPGGMMALTPAQVTAVASASCTGWIGEGEHLPATLDLVVDARESMSDSAPSSQNSKTLVTREALNTAIAGLPPSVSLGALFFSHEHARSAHDSDKDVRDHELIPHITTSNRSIVIITDGAPTLDLRSSIAAARNGGTVTDQPTQPIIDEIVAARALGILTFIIGSPGSQVSLPGGKDMRPWLSAAAVAGGTNIAGCSVDGPTFCHLDMTQAPDFGAALTAGLAQIAGQVIDSCAFKLPAPPSGQTIDPDLMNLIVIAPDGASKLVLPSRNTGTEGWTFDGTGNVVLSPQTCNEVKGDAPARVRLVFGCQSGVVPPVK